MWNEGIEGGPAFQSRAWETLGPCQPLSTSSGHGHPLPSPRPCVERSGAIRTSPRAWSYPRARWSCWRELSLSGWTWVLPTALVQEMGTERGHREGISRGPRSSGGGALSVHLCGPRQPRVLGAVWPAGTSHAPSRPREVQCLQLVGMSQRDRGALALHANALPAEQTCPV